jgi:glycosyltransferase involved in cell wall biosynthesis
MEGDRKVMARRTVFLMPVYNPARDVLLRTVDSLLGQTEAADIVIVDDGSLQPVSEVLGSREGIIVLRLARNGGITAALNYGLEHIVSLGYEYVARMDCGDISAPERVAKQQAYMDSHPATDLVGAFADIVDERGNHLFFEGTPGGRAAIGRKLYDNAAFKHPTFFFRTACVRKFGVYSADYPHAEDYEFMRRLFERGEIDCLHDVLLVYEKNADGISSRNRRTQLRSRLRVQLGYFQPAKPAAYAGVVRSLVTLLVPARIWTRLSRLYWDRQDKRVAVNSLPM